MSDGSEQIDQNDVEALLAAAGKGAPEPAPPVEDSGDDVSMGQDEIEALMSGGAPTAATATVSPREASSAPAAGSPTPFASGSTNDVELLLNKAQEAIASISDTVDELPPGVQPFRLESFGGSSANEDAATLELVRDVSLDLKIELGRTRMPLEDVLRLRREVVITLDKLAGDPVDVYANGRLIARGESASAQRQFLCPNHRVDRRRQRCRLK